MRGHLGGLPPAVKLAEGKTLGEILINASRDGMIDSAHDLSEGGLGAAIAEMALRFGVGARIAVDEICERDGVDPFTALFSETQARALVALPRSEELRFTDMTSARGFPAMRLGVVDTSSGGLEITGPFEGGSIGIGLDELKEAWSSVLPQRFGHILDAEIATASGE